MRAAGFAASRQSVIDGSVGIVILGHIQRPVVNLKLLSLCMGHVRTQMTEHYIMEAGLTQQVQEAAMQVAYGPA